jgi:mRNA-degrading endonuclease YafQ of YafQ-DinJ toxin-antitoxin module
LSFATWCKDPSHNALKHHPLHGRSEGWWSVKIGIHYLVLYRVLEEAGVKKYLWDWIGTHEAFNTHFPR